MGNDFCKTCVNKATELEIEEKNLVDNNILNTFGKIDNTPSIFGMSKSKNQTIDIAENSQISTRKKDYFRRRGNNFTDITTEYGGMSSDREFPFRSPQKIDKRELDKIVLTYKLNAVLKCFKRLKEMKEEAHKIIIIEKSLYEQRDNLIVEGEEDLDVDLFPEEEYDYIGSFFKDKKDGFGIQIYPTTNATYVGKFMNDRRIDYCKFNDPSKKYTFKGEVYKNFTGRYGIYINTESEIYYEGEWMNNRKQGYGIEIYKDKSFYEGEFFNGQKHGIGVYKWVDNSKYEGEWKNNLLDGYGIYEFKDKTYYIGHWNHNQMNGFGEFVFPGLKTYMGYFENDSKNGFGILIWTNSERAFVGYWKDNKQEGPGKYIINDKVRYGYWKSGKKIEKYQDYDKFRLKLSKNEKNYLHIFDMNYMQLEEFIDKLHSFN